MKVKKHNTEANFNRMHTPHVIYQHKLPAPQTSFIMLHVQWSATKATPSLLLSHKKKPSKGQTKFNARKWHAKSFRIKHPTPRALSNSLADTTKKKLLPIHFSQLCAVWNASNCINTSLHVLPLPGEVMGHTSFPLYVHWHTYRLGKYVRKCSCFFTFYIGMNNFPKIKKNTTLLYSRSLIWLCTVAGESIYFGPGEPQVPYLGMAWDVVVAQRCKVDDDVQIKHRSIYMQTWTQIRCRPGERNRDRTLSVYSSTLGLLYVPSRE